MFVFSQFIGFCFCFCFCCWWFQRDRINNDGKDMAAGAESRETTSHLYTGKRQNRTWGEAIRLKTLLRRYFLHLVSTSSWFHSLCKLHRQLGLSVYISLWGMCLIQATTQSYNRFFKTWWPPSSLLLCFESIMK